MSQSAARETKPCSVKHRGLSGPALVVGDARRPVAQVVCVKTQRSTAAGDPWTHKDRSSLDVDQQADSDSKQHVRQPHVRQQHVRQHGSTSDSSWRLDMRGHWGLRRTSILVSTSSGSTEDPQPDSSSDPGPAGTRQDQDAVAAVPHGGRAGFMVMISASWFSRSVIRGPVGLRVRVEMHSS